MVMLRHAKKAHLSGAGFQPLYFDLSEKSQADAVPRKYNWSQRLLQMTPSDTAEWHPPNAAAEVPGLEAPSLNFTISCRIAEAGCFCRRSGIAPAAR
jgi:hypothetical protein